VKRRAPPWGAIEAFIVAARSRSFKDAAAQLGLSPAAFSRRIQSLESHVGVRLFDRTAPLPALTTAGEACLKRLQPGYDAMRAATDELSCSFQRGRVRIGVSHSVAISWLVPRLPRFYAQRHGIELVLQWNNEGSDLAGGTADIGIMYGEGDWEHLSSQKLLELNAFVVAPQRFADGRTGPTRLEELADYRLLDLIYPARHWDDWLQRAGYCASPPKERVTFDCAQVMYEAAARGVGVALAVSPLVDAFLLNGRLKKAFDLTLRSSGAYYLVALPAARRQKDVRSVWQWLAAEAAAPSIAAAA
jgi:LysR family transcriptional regulator, glycine cleavage system transcriptional activator